MAIVGAASLVLLVLVVLVVFPPRVAPRWWRHHTRPIRRVVRPGHYRSW